MIFRRPGNIRRYWAPGIDLVLRSLNTDPAVQIAGRDGSMSLANPGCTFLDPPTGQAIAANRAYNLVGPGGLTLPMYTAFPAVTNLFLNSQAPATQDINVVTGSVIVTALGGGYTLETAANTATGSGFGAVTLGTSQVLTITGNGSITLTVAGTPVGATVQVQTGTLRTPLLVTDGSTKTRAADANVWTMADALTQDEEIAVIAAQPYADGDIAVASLSWLSRAAGGAGSYPAIIRGAATRMDVYDYNGTDVYSDDVTRTIPNRSVTFLQRVRRTPTSLTAGYGNTASASPTAMTGTLNATSAFYLHGTSAARAPYAMVCAIRRKGGFSQAQIDALYYSFANGRTVPVLA